MQTLRPWLNRLHEKTGVHWPLLFFLVLFIDVKLFVKCIALVLAFVSHPRFYTGYTVRKNKLPLFYPAMAIIVLLNMALYWQTSLPYIAVQLTGLFFWVSALLAIHYLRQVAGDVPAETLHRTISIFFYINIAVSIIQLFFIFTEIGLRNPFIYQGSYQKYFMNTGDHIRGISFDSSTTNAIISLFAFIYFLHQKKFVAVILSTCVLLLTGSNFINGLFALSMLTLFIFQSNRAQKSMLSFAFFMLIVFMMKVSPQNNKYVFRMIDEYILHKHKNHNDAENSPTVPLRLRPDSLLDEQSRREKKALLYLDSLERQKIKQTDNSLNFAVERPIIPGDSIHTISFQSSRDTNSIQHSVIKFVTVNAGSGYDTGFSKNWPGKLVAYLQSAEFLLLHPAKIFLGTGAGNFSSKLAFKATGLNLVGGFPERCRYIHPDFLRYHFSLHAHYYTRHASVHSLVHHPGSVYNQLITEYGVAGLLAFVLLYLGYFVKRWHLMQFSKIILGLLLLIFTSDYWFEQLSIVPLFELLFFIDTKSNINIPATSD